MNRAVIVVWLGMAGCFDGKSAACMSSTEALCETCPTNDYADLICKCLAERELTADDYSDIQKIAFDVETNEDAQRTCDRIVIETQYASDDEETECREAKAYLDAYGADACDDLGWTD